MEAWVPFVQADCIVVRITSYNVCYTKLLREPVIVRDQSFSVKPMSVEEAVMQMDLLHKDFLVYTDSASEDINVVYRRKDGNYGLISPQK